MSPGEKGIVPEADFSSYYGHPIIKEPTWAALDIAGYLFLGGLAGASSVLAAGADLQGRPGLAAPAKYAALGAISVSLVALVHDLGRPKRFLNMLRVFKPTSPMSVGVWILSAYAPMAGVAAASQATGNAPALGRAGTAGAALIGPAVAAYTGVLISDTAVPAWHEGHREMPVVFAGSACVAAAGLGMLAAPLHENGAARRLGVMGAIIEMTASRVMHKRMGMVSGAYSEGRAGVLMHASEALTVAGAVGGIAVARRSRVGAALSGAALMAASACLRFGVFEAGVKSARDPKYTVIPQRERITHAAR